MLQHQEDVDARKAANKAIIENNVQTIRNLTDGIKDLRRKERRDQEHLSCLVQKKKEVEEPLMKKLEEKRELEGKLNACREGRLVLNNRQAQFKQLGESMTEAKKSCRIAQQACSKSAQERNDLYLCLHTTGLPG